MSDANGTHIWINNFSPDVYKPDYSSGILMVFGTVPEGFVNGSCVARGVDGGYGLIDAKGKIIIPCET
jgi:hypothetical protein